MTKFFKASPVFLPLTLSADLLKVLDMMTDSGQSALPPSPER